MSKIQWTDETWNPTTGCTKISPGCLNCYIERTPPMRMAGRKFVKGKIPLELHEDRLDKPLQWKKPRRIFVNSMSDLFHEDIPDAFIRRVFAVVSLAGQHTFQILTKRADRLASWFRDHPENSLSACQAEYCVEDGYPRTPTGKSRVRDLRSINGSRSNGEGNLWPLRNVWLGVSVENQEQADRRIPPLLQTPAAVRFLSCEPLLSDIDLSEWIQFQGPTWRYSDADDSTGRPGIDWVIVGGESGPNSRQAHLEWFRDIIRQCKAASVPVFMKQTGQCVLTGRSSIDKPSVATQAVMLKDKKGGDMKEWPSDLRVREFPK
jgi:protein gp37